MSDFLDILTHGRRLQGAVKELSIEELQDVATKLQAVIEKRKESEAAKLAAEAEKQEKLNALRAQMEADGIDIEDLMGSSTPKKSKRAGQKRPVKYILQNEDGEHPWTGVGRMPKVFVAALDAGKSLSDFAV